MSDGIQPVTTKAAYALWAPTYPPVAHNALMQTEQAAVASILAPLRPFRALDAGTGSGRMLQTLGDTAAAVTIGLDASPDMLAQGRSRHPRVCADARRMPFPAAAFDLINASLMAGDIADLPDWLRECARVLTQGGHLTYSDFHPNWSANGWRRTFQSIDGATIDLPFVPHAIADHHEAVRAAGLDVAACLERPLADGSGPDVAAFQRRWGNPPVVVVVHARKRR